MSHIKNRDFEPEARGFYSEATCDSTSSAEELRECAEQTRESMDRTLSELEERVSPSNLWRRIREAFLEGNGRSFNIEQTVSRHPTSFAVIGSGLLLLGAGIAAYAFSKMRNDDADSLSARRWPIEEDVFSPDDYRTPPHEAEPAVTPPADEVPNRSNLEEEATTEEIQKQMMEETRDQQEGLEKPNMRENQESIIITGQSEIKEEEVKRPVGGAKPEKIITV